MGRLLVFVWIIVWSAQNSFADKIIHADNPTNINAMKYTKEENSAGPLYFMSAINERFAKNQAQSSECMINSSISDFPEDLFTTTTTPEFFTNVMSTFIMDSDMGVSTIIGSLMFNTLGVAAVAGLASIKQVKLDWRPISRDSILYSINLLVLIWFSWDSKITLYESLVLVTLYFAYFVILFQNNRIRNFVFGFFAKPENSRKSYESWRRIYST